MQRHDTFELVGEFRTMQGLAAAEGIARRVMRMRQMVHAGQHGAKMFSIVADATNGNAAEADAVIAALAPDQPGARAVAPHAVISERNFQGAIHRFGAGVGIKDMVQSVGQHGGEALGGLEGQRVAHLEGRREIHLRRLALDGLDDARPAMPGIDAP